MWQFNTFLDFAHKFLEGASTNKLDSEKSYVVARADKPRMR